MNPPFFQIVNVPGVQAIFGSHPLRVWLFGEAPEKEARPYATFQTIGGVPENYINQVPDSDNWDVQVDVYTEAEEGKQADAIALVVNGAKALRDAIEPFAHITAWRGCSREVGTRFYRYSFDVSFVTER